MQLNLPAASFNIREQGGSRQIFDQWRRRFVRLTPEEWVRQHFLRFAVDCLGFPSGRMAVEQQIEVNGTRKRCDAVAYDALGQPLVILEFKAPDVKLGQRVFDQLAVYNSRLHVPYLMVSNGLEHYACRVDVAASRYLFFEQLPNYSQLLSL